MSSKPSVVVIHPEAVVAESIATALAGSGHQMAFECASNATEGIRIGARADVAVVHEGLVGVMVCARRLRALGVRVILLGSGPVGHSLPSVPTDAPLRELASAIFPGAVPEEDVMGALTDRERQILSLVAEGLAGKQVARVLGISPKTVERHKTRIYAKLRVPNQAAAVGLMARHFDHGEFRWNLSSI